MSSGVDFLFTVVGGCYHALNPAVYYYFNKNFRKATKSYFREEVCSALFVFSIYSLKQNAGSLLTPVSDTVFYALSHGTLGFAFHGSFNNQLIQRI